MLPEDGLDAVVSYTVKELLDDIRTKLEVLISRIDAKVDRTELQVFTQRQDDLIGRVDALEMEQRHSRETQAAQTEERRYRMPVQLTVILVVATLFLIGLGVAGLVMHL